MQKMWNFMNFLIPGSFLTHIFTQPQKHPKTDFFLTKKVLDHLKKSDFSQKDRFFENFRKKNKNFRDRFYGFPGLCYDKRTTPAMFLRSETSDF